MAENSVVKDQLTDAMVDAGEALTRKLDELGLPTNAAFWFFMPESNEWRLLFASAEVSAKGSRAVYKRIHQAIEQLGPEASATPLSVVGVLDADDDLVRLLVGVVSTPGISRIRFAKNGINGHFIDDTLIYRMTSPGHQPGP